MKYMFFYLINSEVDIIDPFDKKFLFRSVYLPY